MSEPSHSNPDPAGAFAKMWSDSCAKVMQAAMSFNPDTVPPELLRQIRTGMMQALTQSWGEYLRSPQFLEGMKQLMEQAVAFRKFSADWLTKARQETQGVAREDIEALRAALGQTENRLAGQLGALSARVNELVQRLDETADNKTATGPPAAPAAGTKAGAARFPAESSQTGPPAAPAAGEKVGAARFPAESSQTGPPAAPAAGKKRRGSPKGPGGKRENPRT